MIKKLTLFALPLLLATGCTNLEPYEERIVQLEWKNETLEAHAGQADVDKDRAVQETKLSQKDVRNLEERLALAYDALREARTQLDEGLQDRLHELSESTTSGERLSISKYGGVVLSSGVFFTPGKHELSNAGKVALKPLVTTLLQEKYDGYEIELAGHTDSDKIRHSARRYRDNYDLASMRSNSVRRFLITAGIPSERIYLSSWGSIHPIDKNTKSKNRRVEIMLRKTVDTLPASAPKAEENK